MPRSWPPTGMRGSRSGPRSCSGEPPMTVAAPVSGAARRRAVTGAAFVVPGAFLGVFFVVPVATLVTTGLRDGGRWELGTVGEVLSSSTTRSVAWFTLWQAVLSTVATVAAALPAAWLIGRVRFPGRSLFVAALIVPFVLHTVRSEEHTSELQSLMRTS